MYCSGCGAEVKDNKKKCPYCKQKLNITAKKTFPKISWNWVKILILCFSLMPIVGYIASFYYRKTDKTISMLYCILATIGLISNICIMIFVK